VILPPFYRIGRAASAGEYRFPEDITRAYAVLAGFLHDLNPTKTPSHGTNVRKP